MIKITEEMLVSLSEEAKTTKRKRKNFNFHKEDSEILQRMLNALEPTTYVRPHKHINPDKKEIFVLLKGKIAVVEFDDFGNITEKIILSHELKNYAAEITPAAWHTVIAFESGSVYYEVKEGPYDITIDKIFAPWAPEEGFSQVDEYLKRIISNL
ncbi:MAG TPA: WbuC family cupin fold metalloprotein [Bacteroidales bacterium]|nr:WbuC family cupin fold metalloprotein [Bacteroidales bacterium]HPS16249.1 WbuC family cupin fold metalloprotein [Bacteroidales bacterium]